MVESSSATKRLLVVEPPDEHGPELGALLDRLLVHEGFLVSRAASRSAAFDALGSERIDLAVIDLSLPNGDGLELLRWLRRPSQPAIAVILLVEQEEDRLAGLELGAHDCLVKPVSLRELAVRIRKCLNGRIEAAGGPARLVVGPIEIDLERHQVRVEQQPVSLTLTEFRLLVDMVRNEGRVRTREALMATLGSDANATSRTIDTHVRRLRVKLGQAKSWISTVRGVGYRLAIDSRLRPAPGRFRADDSRSA